MKKPTWQQLQNRMMMAVDQCKNNYDSWKACERRYTELQKDYNDLVAKHAQLNAKQAVIEHCAKAIMELV